MIYSSREGAAVVEAGYRAALDAWPAPREERSLPTSFGETFVVSSGPVPAPPLVLLHGSSANAAAWADAIPAWAAHRRVHAVDIPGEPGGSTPTRLDLATDETARWLDEVLDALGVTGADVVGESLGGWVAIDHATRRPGRVTRLALLCPGGIGRQRTESVLVALVLRAAGLRRSMAYLVGTDAIPDAAVEVQRHFRPRMQPLPIFDDATLRGLTMPVLVVAGERDRLFDTAGTRRRLAATTDAEVVVLPGRGHALPRETDRILAFLDRER